MVLRFEGSLFGCLNPGHFRTLGMAREQDKGLASAVEKVFTVDLTHYLTLLKLAAWILVSGPPLSVCSPLGGLLAAVHCVLVIYTGYISSSSNRTTTVLLAQTNQTHHTLYTLCQRL